MKKDKWSLGLSAVAIFISIVAMCAVYGRNKELDMDWYGALIGILSLLVTLLLGWQLFNAITVESRLAKEKESINNHINKEIDKAKTELIQKVSNIVDSEVADMLLSLSAAYIDLDQADASFLYGLNAIGRYVECKDYEKANINLNALLHNRLYNGMRCHPVIKDSILKLAHSEKLASLEHIIHLRGMVGVFRNK